MAELLHTHMPKSTDNRAVAWPKPSRYLTCVPRRPQHRLSSQAGYKSWRHPLAQKLKRNPTTPRWHHLRARNLRAGPGPAPAPELCARLFRETCRWSRTVPADRQCVPAVGAGDISTVSAAHPVPIAEPRLTFEGTRS